MGMEMKDIKGWFAEERKAQGHAGSGSTTPKERAPAVEVRARLPVSTRGARPSASYDPRQKEEYVEEEMKSDVNPLWSEPAELSITIYSYDPEDQEPSEVAILDASALYDNGDMESQDSGFKHASTTEIDIKEHGIGQAEEPISTDMPPVYNDPPFPKPSRSRGAPVKLNARDPRRRQVSLASTASLYGRTATPMADPMNIAQGSSDMFRLQDLSMEDAAMPSEGEDNLVIDVDNE